jgi:hypothetical protein
MKPGDLVFIRYDGDVNFKAGDAGLIVARTVLPHPDNNHDQMLGVLVNGKIEYLFDYEMVLVDGAERLPSYKRNEIE